ncbi:MAG: GGDEF domain-containing protein [Synechococcus sp.]
MAAASSLHLEAAFCTANDSVLTRLAMARSGLGEGAAPQSGELVRISMLNLDGQSNRLLQQPPSALVSQAISGIGLARLVGPGPRRRAGRQPHPSHSQPCADHGLQELRQQTRVFPLVPPGMQPEARQELVYALGPWTRPDGSRTMVLAGTDIHRLVESVGDLEGHASAGHEPHRIPMSVDITLREAGPGAGADSSETERAPVSHRMASDQKLDHGPWMPFANGNLAIQVSVDHSAIDRISRRAAALAFTMGLGATMIVVLISRYSQLKLLVLNEALRRESRTDDLTQLANRRAWDEALLRADQLRQREAHTYAVVVIDLDGFKQINDTQGHQKGDQVLIQTATVLRNAAREVDVAARLGGDEFGLLLINPSPEGLQQCLRRLRRALEAHSIQSSIGASLSQPTTSLEQTWSEADGSMYAAKSSK